jgi:hypothetical protein
MVQCPQGRHLAAYQVFSSPLYTECYFALYVTVSYRADEEICNHKTTQCGHNKKEGAETL